MFKALSSNPSCVDSDFCRLNNFICVLVFGDSNGRKIMKERNMCKGIVSWKYYKQSLM